MIYLLVKSAHIVFVIALMASLMIFPRYKIHQMSSTPGEPLFETMKDASQTLRKIVMNPSLILVWILGLTMIAMNQAMLSQGWLHAKIVLVLILSGIHGWLVGVGRSIDNDTPKISQKTLRVANEIPFLLMIGIVVLVVVRPF